MRSQASRLLLPGLLISSVGVAACRDVAPVEAEAVTESREEGDCTQTNGIPDELRCTGLYSDWASRTFDPSVRAFAPAFELWSDGAKKTRFIQLPPGSRIDARDMNAWVFPVGTKLWKEFRLDTGSGALSLVETRMLHKTAPSTWTATTYVWSADQASAKRVTNGIMPFPGTQSYEVPAERMCNRCHAGRADHVLGFEATLLAAPEATGLTYQKLVDEGLLDMGDAGAAEPPPAAALQIPGRPAERDAIGRLHANCGIACHNPTGPAPFSMRLDVENGALPKGIEDTRVFKEAIGQESFFAPEDGTGTYYRIRPGDEDRSMVLYRLSHRDGPGGHTQMPPVATHQTDATLIASVKAWIDSMTSAPYPAPGPI
jgi:hypothetical protein